MLRDHPVLRNPLNAEQVLETIRVQLAVKRSSLVVRVPLGPSGVALDGKELPHLPGSMVQIMGGSRRTGAETISTALEGRRATEWIIQGQESVTFRAAKDKKLTLAANVAGERGRQPPILPQNQGADAPRSPQSPLG